MHEHIQGTDLTKRLQGRMECEKSFNQTECKHRVLEQQMSCSKGLQDQGDQCIMVACLSSITFTKDVIHHGVMSCSCVCWKY